jgi:hypothetical protein
MNAPHMLVRIGLTFSTLSALSGCASSGQRVSAERPQTPAPATAAAQAATTAPRRPNAFVLTAAEIATVPGIANAHDAVQTLRPNFLRTRGSAARPATLIGVGAEGQATGRRPGRPPGSQGGADPGAPGDNTPSATNRAAEDPGILVYIDRQRYGALQTLREIPVATIEEIRYLNVGEANSLFGMGHPHGVIQIVTKRGTSSQ